MQSDKEKHVPFALKEQMHNLMSENQVLITKMVSIAKRKNNYKPSKEIFYSDQLKTNSLGCKMRDIKKVIDKNHV